MVKHGLASCLRFGVVQIATQTDDADTTEDTKDVALMVIELWSGLATQLA